MNVRRIAVPTRDPTQCAVASRKGRPTLQCDVDLHEKAAVLAIQIYLCQTIYSCFMCFISRENVLVIGNKKRKNICLLVTHCFVAN